MTGKYPTRESVSKDFFLSSMPRFLEGFPSNTRALRDNQQHCQQERYNCHTGDVELATGMGAFGHSYSGTWSIKYLEENTSSASIHLEPSENQLITTAVEATKLVIDRYELTHVGYPHA